jgi:hypothetical protein
VVIVAFDVVDHGVVVFDVVDQSVVVGFDVVDQSVVVGFDVVDQSVVVGFDVVDQSVVVGFVDHQLLDHHQLLVQFQRHPDHPSHSSVHSLIPFQHIDAIIHVQYSPVREHCCVHIVVVSVAIRLVISCCIVVSATEVT